MPQTKRVSEAGVERKLISLLEKSKRVRSARSFKDAEVLTRNKGVVVKLHNGQKFQLTIVEDR
jgi:hypothetical protein